MVTIAGNDRVKILVFNCVQGHDPHLNPHYWGVNSDVCTKVTKLELAPPPPPHPPPLPEEMTTPVAQPRLSV